MSDKIITIKEAIIRIKKYKKKVKKEIRKRDKKEYKLLY